MPAQIIHPASRLGHLLRAKGVQREAPRTECLPCARGLIPPQSYEECIIIPIWQLGKMRLRKQVIYRQVQLIKGGMGM